MSELNGAEQFVDIGEPSEAVGEKGKPFGSRQVINPEVLLFGENVDGIGLAVDVTS